MRKKIIALGLIGVMSLGLVACGDKTENEVVEETADAAADTTEAEVLDCTYDPADYVTLGDYKGIVADLASGEYAYTEEGYNSYMSSTLADSIGYVESDEKTVAADSIVNVDYVGSQDGVAFDGGSAEDQEIDVAGNCSTSGSGYIDGFTSGLPGANVGDEVAYEVTFPDNYGNADLAGQTVTFSFKINSILKPVSLSDVTDAQIADNFDYTTVAEFKTAMKDEYNTYVENNLKSAKESAVVSAIVANATINGYPENLVKTRVDMYVASMDTQLASYGMTFQNYVESVYGYSYDTVLEELNQSFIESTQQQMVFELIAKAEGLEIDKETYDNYVSDMIAAYGLSDEETFYANYAVGNLSGRDYFDTIYLADQAIQFCIDNATLNY